MIIAAGCHFKDPIALRHKVSLILPITKDFPSIIINQNLKVNFIIFI